MKLSVLFLFALAFSASAIAQTETAASKSSFATFKKHYNAGNTDSIYASFSAETKVALPVDKTRAFITQLNTGLGQLLSGSFIGYRSGFGDYKADFQKGILLLSIATNDKAEIMGLNAKPYQEPAMPRNLTAMSLPFTGEWFVFWGGDTKEQNYHVASAFQKNAFDIVKADASGRSFKTDGVENADYYAFGQSILAPCDGEVVLAVDGVKDNRPGKMNPLFATGNTVMLKTKNNEYVLLAHLQQGSVRVKQGDAIKTGQLLGRCGNSGNSSEPHLHFDLQTGEDFSSATGIKCFFGKVTVNGESKKEYSPVKGERIKN